MSSHKKGPLGYIPLADQQMILVTCHRELREVTRATILSRFLRKAVSRQTATCWGRWCDAVRKANEEHQHADRLRWFVHARANRDNDLLAWYHSTFCREVYRQRVPFWYRETRLQHYQKTYRVVDDGPDSYTPMEKSIMTSCVCTVGTKYPDVAAQIFTAKEVLTVEEYRLFQTLVKLGAEVSKAAPKSGKRAPYPMKLRLWFDRGALCLTSKRQKPNRAYTTDYSFYLSKVKICLLLPGRAAAKEASAATIAGAGALGVMGQGRHAEGGEDLTIPRGSTRASGPIMSVDSSSSSRVRRAGLAWARAWAGAKALARVGSGNDDGDLGGSKGPADGSWSNVLLNPRYFDRGCEEAGLAGAQHVPGRRDSVISSGSVSVTPSSSQGVGGDEADRGAGDRDGDGAAWEEASDTSTEFAVGPSNERVSTATRHVLSIKFFGRLAPLELWFAKETEGELWQGMLTKLAWKEQGYLYSAPNSEEAVGGEVDVASPGQARGEQHEDQPRVARNSFFSSSSGGGGSSVSSGSIASTPVGDDARYRHLPDEGDDRRDDLPVPVSFPMGADASRGVHWQRDEEKTSRGDLRERGVVLSPASVSTGSCSPTESMVGTETAKLVESTSLL